MMVRRTQIGIYTEFINLYLKSSITSYKRV